MIQRWKIKWYKDKKIKGYKDKKLIDKRLENKIIQI